MQIRKATIDDVEYNKDTLIKYFYELLEVQEINYKKSKAEENYDCMKRFIMDGSANIFCAFEQKKILGFIWCYEIKPQIFHINYFYVTKEKRNIGIGQKLIDMVYEYAKECNIKEIELLVDVNNVLAKRKYERNGFKEEKIKMKKIL